MATMKRAILYVLVTTILAGCGGQQPISTPTRVLFPPVNTPTPTPITSDCKPKKVTPFLEDFDRILEEWDDADDLARNTGRGSLSPAIQRLQEVKRKVGELEDICIAVVELKEATTEYMELSIDSYLLFMAQEEDSKVAAKFSEASKAFGIVADKYLVLKGIP